MRFIKSHYQNNSFIGLFSRASDRLVLADPSAPAKFLHDLQDALAVPVARLFINQSNLLGLFCVMNSFGAVLAPFVEKSERTVLTSHGLNALSLKHSTPGNNILANDHAAWVSPRLTEPDRKVVADALDVEVITQRFSLPALATSTVVTNSGLFSSSELTDTELKGLESIFKVKGSLGSTNLGVTFNALGLVANSRGGVVGSSTSGFEMQRIYEALSG